MSQGQIRTYDRQRSIVFLKTNEKFGGLSNMAGGFPLVVNGVRILTSEALYQACRFPHLPDVQKLIIAERSPMTAKMKSKPYRHDSRPDWDRVRVKIMRWCLRVKLAQNWRAFSELLLEAGERPIVEESRKDSFWGANPIDEQTLVGMNVLGRLLMELRENVKSGSQASLLRVEPLGTPDFLLIGMPIGAVTAGEALGNDAGRDTLTQRPLFDISAKWRSPSEYVVSAKVSELKSAGTAPNFDVRRSWKLKRLWDIARIRCERNRPALPLLSVFLNRGVIRYDEGGGQVHKPSLDLSVYQVVQVGDFVLNNQQAWRGSVGVSRHEGIISPAYVVLALSGDLEPPFADYLFQSKDMVSQYLTASKGVGDIQRDVHMPWLKNIKVPVPPGSEQAAIVRFLDWANGRLERAIRAKRKVIALLNEQKQAIVHRAVTRGLDLSVPLKPSGTPWLGDIPKHWRVIRNMALFAHRVESGVAGLPVLQVSLRSGITSEELDQFGRPKRLIADPAKYKRIYKGDLAYNTMRMWQGAAGVSPSDGLVSPAYVVLNPRNDTCADYYDFVFHTDVYKQQVNRQSTGIVSDRNRLYWDSFKQMANIFPPRHEQEAIVAFIHSETRSLNTTVSRLEREIDLLREYRTRLVADVVTGKLDVREAAARLPEEAAPDIAEDDSDMSDEIESADEEAAA